MSSQSPVPRCPLSSSLSSRRLPSSLSFSPRLPLAARLAKQTGHPWVVPPVMEALKAKAKAAGLWNFFLPPNKDFPHPFGAKLSNLVRTKCLSGSNCRGASSSDSALTLPAPSFSHPSPLPIARPTGLRAPLRADWLVPSSGPRGIQLQRA